MGSTILRPLRAEDIGPLLDIHSRQCAGGEPYAFPDLFDPHYAPAMVLERDGVPVAAVIGRRTFEVFMIADDPGLAREIIGHRTALERALRAEGADEVHAFVPRVVAKSMRALLARLGFRPSNDRFTTFYREV